MVDADDTSPPSAQVTLDTIRNTIKAEYNRIWAEWYRDMKDLRPAELVIELGEHSPGYHDPTNRMMFFYGENDFADFGRKRPLMPVTRAGWFTYKGELVHEMLHEYQFKSRLKPSEIGRRLCDRFGNCFAGPGHTPEWFTAIVEKSSYFHITIKELLTEIGVHPKLVAMKFPDTIPDGS